MYTTQHVYRLVFAWFKRYCTAKRHYKFMWNKWILFPHGNYFALEKKWLQQRSLSQQWMKPMHRRTHRTWLMICGILPQISLCAQDIVDVFVWMDCYKITLMPWLWYNRCACTTSYIIVLSVRVCLAALAIWVNCQITNNECDFQFRHFFSLPMLHHFILLSVLSKTRNNAMSMVWTTLETCNLQSLGLINKIRMNNIIWFDLQEKIQFNNLQNRMRLQTNSNKINSLVWLAICLENTYYIRSGFINKHNISSNIPVLEREMYVGGLFKSRLLF